MNKSMAEHLTEMGYKITTNRLKIFECIQSRKHFDTKYIMTQHKKIFGEKPNTMSVYNSLNMLLKHELIKIRQEGQKSFYEHVHDHIHVYTENDYKRRHTENEDAIISDIKEILNNKYKIKALNIDIDIKIEKDK